MKRWIMLAMMSFLGAGLLAADVASQEADRDFSPKTPSSEEMAKMFQRMQECATPSKYHERLEVFLGEWDVEMKVWMGGTAGGPPMESKGASVSRWLLDGRWLMTETNAPIMGMPMEMVSILGYDNFKKKYIAVSVDTMTTAAVLASGPLDPGGKVILLYGEIDEPGLEEVGKPVKSVIRILDDDHYVMEIHDLALGEKNTQVLEFAYTRKKGEPAPGR